MPHTTVSSIVNLRDKFSRPEKDRIPNELKRALSLLNLTSLTKLEERFLATTAFLVPWAVFRDSCLLVNDSRASEPTLISRLDILWFYTQFDESLCRHDPRIAKPGAHFEIDKSEWSHAEHEKHLYAWLLQTFCVGKVYSPFGFRYFELRNVCTAWVEVFVPIINAVRASYSVKGRRHYGRLALFIEDRCPSRLAFPEGNVSMPAGVMNSPTPFRIISRQTHLRGASQTVLTKKSCDETERELRDVYPQYGGLVERPRFKHKMDDWLELQRERAAHRKTIVRPEVVQYVPKYQPEVVQGSQQVSAGRSPMKSTLKKKGSTSPIKQYADGFRRSLSMNIGSNRMGRTEPQSPLSPTPQEPKSPLHGVTRQIEIPEDDENDADSSEAWPLPATRLPRPRLPEQRFSEQSSYTTIHHSSPYGHGTPDNAVEGSQRLSVETEDPVWSPMGAPSAIPRPLNKVRSETKASSPQPLLEVKKSVSEARHPSYEGNGYQEEISLTNLHARQASAGSLSVSSDAVPPKPRSRLPAPIKLPPPYVNQHELRVASDNTYRNDVVPKASTAPWPPEDSNPTAWPSNNKPWGRRVELSSEIAPPIPAKSPERRAAKRGLRSEQLVREHSPDPQGLTHPALRDNRTEFEMLRIVSKENIRAALGDLTPESSIEDLRARAKAPSRVASPPRLETYNSHMFPRKDARPNGP
ncbi:uncharacterized protein M421DRAFT_392803 [Didymella exigua CBS 183.55]|uniref:Uncharacterized protein n=1 Tax=Didymella exigua CBS 183.55 TaxID=1150837 RepID=A0A6A5RM69_9PLEO|nr:uncharacterized protein M421DRAFT_392803 [Didymella exigua CBS 183.55]KAF1928094.1 hypothetical protein M421DRAFT_392803 [Didymella exigua CBS 183.55]